MPKIVTVVGARPQFIKCAVLSRLTSVSEEVDEILVHTGQHYDSDMSDIFFDQMKIPTPKYNLNISGSTHGKMTADMLDKLEQVLMLEKPAAVVVYGDTNSTLAGALAAAKLDIPVLHIEAGLRSFNRKMPEELNRVLTDHVSSRLYCSTNSSIKNLSSEGIKNGVLWVGDVMKDATLFAKRNPVDTSIFTNAFGENKPVALCTLHRAENTNSRNRLAELFLFIETHSSDFDIVFPLHPRTKNAAQNFGLKLPNVNIVDPIGYFETQSILARSALVLTDSGGLQKEAYFHQVPCITMREETEWVELVENGWNRLWQTSEYSLRKEISEYGNGDAGDKILRDITNFLGAL